MTNPDDARFSEPTDKFTVLKLELSGVLSAGRRLGAGCRWGGLGIRSKLRGSEKKLLALCFKDWAIPYEGRLKGWRQDSPIYIVEHEELLGGTYLCDRNEFNEDSGWGQFHYSFMHPAHRGKGLYSALLSRVVQKAQRWGLEGLYVNTDRRGHPEMYTRWGFVPWKTIPKRKRTIMDFVRLIGRRAALPRPVHHD